MRFVYSNIFVYLGCIEFLKLHSKQLEDPTQPYLVGESGDIVFPCHKNNKKNKKPHQSSTGWKGPTCLIFGDHVMGVKRLSGLCLKGVYKVSGECLVGV